MTRDTLRRFGLAAALAASVLSGVGGAQSPAPAQSSPDMIARIFSGEFSAAGAAPPRWFDGGRSYIVEESTTAPGASGSDVVKYDTATGTQRDVLITAAQLTPKGAGAALDIESLSWSDDRQRVLLFTNARRVWRTNARGDYWVLDRRANTLRKIGGSAPDASLMYAKFSPNASKVAYVRRNDIYVEDLASGDIKRITRDGGDLVINGGSDWVNEEELALQDCFRWSPDGRRIAYWQFNLSGVGNFPLLYALGTPSEIVTAIPYPSTGPYPVTLDVPYPLAGTTNSAVRVGVVSADGGTAKWLEVPGDPRDHYIARLQWVDPGTVLIQQLNRLQNTETYLLADANSGATRRMWQNRDDAFITIGFGGLPEAKPIRGGAEFLVSSERDGWMRVYRVTRDGRETMVTRGNMDVMSIAGVDEQRGWLYVTASPENATQRYLYRASLDGMSDPVRVTPLSFEGTNTYDISPDGGYAFHRHSRFDDPGSSRVVTLPDHHTVRATGDNAALKGKLADLLSPPVDYFKADAGDGVMVAPTISPRVQERPFTCFSCWRAI